MNLVRALVWAVFIIACAASFARAEETYRLGPDDVAQLVVYGEKELSGDYKVGPEGMIAVPLIGEVKVGGLSLRAAEDLITQKFADGYLIDPSVTIQVTSSRPFYIMGEVKNPGSYPYVANMTVLNAVALAGGYTYRADKNDVEITRGTAEEDAAPNAKIFPGDVITVSERFF